MSDSFEAGAFSVKKFFLDTHKEEEWLNEQGQNGLMLTRYHGGEYEFENVSPVKYQYKIDQPVYTGSKKKTTLIFWSRPESPS